MRCEKCGTEHSSTVCPACHGMPPDPVLPFGEVPLVLTPPGISLRDWFAGMAMQGYLIADGAPQTARGIVQDAYTLADAMLVAREVKQ